MITNYLSPLEFELSIKRIPNVTFFVQRVNLPGISVAAVPQLTPFNTVWHTPDKIDFQELQLSFIIDEKMENYREIFEWMIAISFPKTFNQFDQINKSDFGLYSDISILIKNSNKNPNIKVDLINAFPISLSDVQLDTTQSDIVYPEATVSFKYDSYTFAVID